MYIYKYTHLVSNIVSLDLKTWKKEFVDFRVRVRRWKQTNMHMGFHANMDCA